MLKPYSVSVWDELTNKYIHTMICMAENKTDARRVFTIETWQWLRVKICSKHKLQIELYQKQTQHRAEQPYAHETRQNNQTLTKLKQPLKQQINAYKGKGEQNMEQTTKRKWLNINEPRIHNQLFDKLGNRHNKVIVEKYERNSAREWVKDIHGSNSESYYLVDGALYWRSGDGLMPCETDFNNEGLNVCWKVVDIITDFKRITGNTILFENKYRQLKRQDYSDGTCFYTLHQWVERPYPHYERDFKVEEGADNLQELIDYMNGQLAFDYEHLNKSYVQNNLAMKEIAEKIIAEETELINFMKQLTALSA